MLTGCWICLDRETTPNHTTKKEKQKQWKWQNQWEANKFESPLHEFP